MNSTAALVAIAVGSNLGDRAAHLRHAARALSSVLQSLQLSSLHETVPVDTPGDQPLYLNAAIVGETMWTAQQLLERLHEVERDHGRQRPYVNAPRTLDLDLILMGSQILDLPGLVVPHPRFRERRFVLEPLAEIAPAMRDPVSGLTIAELLARLPPAPPTPIR